LSLAFKPSLVSPICATGFSPAAWKQRKAVARADPRRRFGSTASGTSPYPPPTCANPQSSPKASCTPGSPHACLWHSSRRWFPRSALRVFLPRHGSQGSQSPGLIPGDAPEALLPERARVLFPRAAQSPIIAESLLHVWLAARLSLAFKPSLVSPLGVSGFFSAAWKPRKAVARTDPRRRSGSGASGASPYTLPPALNPRSSPKASCAPGSPRFCLRHSSPSLFSPVGASGFSPAHGSQGSQPPGLVSCDAPEALLPERARILFPTPSIPDHRRKPPAHMVRRVLGAGIQSRRWLPRSALRVFSRGMEAKEVSCQGWFPATLRKPRFRSEPVSSSPRHQSIPNHRRKPPARLARRALASGIQARRWFPRSEFRAFLPRHGSQGGQPPGPIPCDAPEAALPERARILFPARHQSPIIAESLLHAWLAALLSPAFKPIAGFPDLHHGLFLLRHGSQGSQSPGLVSCDAPEATLPERARILFPTRSIPNHRRKPPARVARRALGAGIQAVAGFPDRRFGLFSRAWKPGRATARAGFPRCSGSGASGASPYPPPTR